MKAILCLVLLAAGALVAVADSGSAGSGSAPAAGSGSAPAAGSGSAPAPTTGSAAGSGSADPVPAPALPPEPSPGARKACAEALNADEKFADSVILIAEKKLHVKMNSEQVLKDLCTLRDHSDSQADVATNKKHVLMAYIAMWLVAAGFVIYLWRKQQGLKLEIANLRRDLDAATKGDK